MVQQQRTNDPTAKPAQVMPEVRNCHARLVLNDTFHQQCSYCPTVKPTRKTVAQSCCIPMLSPPHSKTSKGQTATCLLQSGVLYTSRTPTGPQQNQQERRKAEYQPHVWSTAIPYVNDDPTALWLYWAARQAHSRLTCSLMIPTHRCLAMSYTNVMQRRVTTTMFGAH